MAAFLQPFFSNKTKINTQQIRVVLEAQKHPPILMISFLTERNE
tara:strand:+ start:1879 stop:2010 length:132 start_codon:yes stop_codon:yes gene_type:complete